MKFTQVFDVLVVYTSGVALSAKLAKRINPTPFTLASGRENYNDAYGYFLSTCKNLGLRAAFCTTKDIVGPGTCDSYWLYADYRWTPMRGLCYARQIFDKFSPITHKKRLERDLLFSSRLVRPFNSPELAALFFDKQSTYQRLAGFCIPTVSINNMSKKGIEDSLSTLRSLILNHVNHLDFSDSIVLKDRFGSGGNNIYKISKNFVQEIFELIQTHASCSFVIQPFMKFETGFLFEKRHTHTDIRLIYQNGKIIQTYLRFAKKDDFRCNEHQGGRLIYTTLSQIPKNVLQFSRKVAKTLPYPNALFALDYIVSNNGHVYFLEGNIGPGIDWNLAKKKNEIMSKKLIRSIVRELVKRSAEIWKRRIALSNPFKLPDYSTTGSAV